MGIDNIEYLENKFKKPIIATHLKDKTRKDIEYRDKCYNCYEIMTSDKNIKNKF